MKLFLFATNHNIQLGSRPSELPDEPKRFRAEIILIVESYAISLLAEELNTEGLSTVLEKQDRSILEEIAGDIRIPHMYCEPTRAQRKSTGLDGEALCAWRESQWLDKLTASNKSPILFVFGADHLSSFSKLASRDNAIKALVLHCDWGSSMNSEVI